jgi:polyisoprenyl-teichoic acid--peptidoglycan teichoic acid transferase
MNRLEFLKKLKLPPLKLPPMRRPTKKEIIFGGVTLVLAAAVFVFARGLTDCWQLTQLPGRLPENCTDSSQTPTGDYTPQPGETALAVPSTPVAEAPAAALPPAWDGASRINILFIGLDARDLESQDGPPRSDTLMLFTVDPISKTAGMLSIPRDMWVNIPGFGYSRINTAYASGEGNKLPGGGPGLAMKTVSQFIGVPVDYYAQVDFKVFTDLVDQLGCIEVFPQEKMILDPIGPGPDHQVLTPGGGRQLCQGWKVLAYARNRHTSGGDFDRAMRQQEVILALQKNIFDPAIFPGLIAKAPQMYDELSYGINTNMSFEDAVKLAILGKDISRSSIKMGVIDTTMVTFDNVVLGGQDASIMKPIADKVRILRDQIFTTSGPTSPMAVPVGNTDAALIAQAMRTEEARVRILDGTFTPGMDQRAGSFFQQQGMTITEVGTATEAYSQTVVIIYGPKLYTLKYLQATFGITSSQIRFSPDPASTVDIEIRLGSDIASRIP